MELSLQNIRWTVGNFGIFGFCLFAPISIAISQIFMGIALMGWIIEMILQKKILWRKTPLDYPIALYILTQLIAVIRAPDIANGLLSWIDTDWFILFYYACINLIEDENDYKIIIKILIISGLTSAVYGIWQHFYGWDFIRQRSIKQRGDFFRSAGFLGFTLTYGGMQLIILSLTFPFIFLISKLKNRLLWSSLLFIIFISIIASYARSAWLGLFACIILLIIFFGRKYLVQISTIGIVFLVIIYFIHPELFFNNGLMSMIDFSDSAPFNNQVRFKLWESSINLMKDHWLLGTGYGNFNSVFEIYKVPFDYRGLNQPHNDFLHVACSTGLIGGIAFLYLWITLLRHTYLNFKFFRQNINIWKVASLGGFLVTFVLLIAGITQEYYHDAETAQIWWFSAAIGILGVINSMEQNNK